ncbi:hypothetical protein BKA82DRAFT_9722 [Pisolithus tinctorius]|nr:hypothetical protein BKA82DRAFT_9722 [Pisolithus tinctorius]
MANSGQGKYSLPEELHRYVLEQPRDTVVAPERSISSSSEVGPSSSHAFERQQQRFSYSPAPNPMASLTTPAIFPSDENSGDRALSPLDSGTPGEDDESGSYSTSFSREAIGEDIGASSVVPQVAMTRNLSRGEMGYGHLAQHSYTIPPPVPPPYPLPGVQGWRPPGEAHLAPWPAHGGRESYRGLEQRVEGEERHELTTGGSRGYEMARYEAGLI